MPFKDREKYNAYMREYRKKISDKKKNSNNKPSNKKSKPIKNKSIFTEEEKKALKNILIRAIRNRTAHKSEDNLITKFIKNF